MAETKIKLRFFTIPQWEQEAQWLRSMHKKRMEAATDYAAVLVSV